MAATKLRKIVGMVMAALMCFALTPAAAFAASGTNDNSGSIEIKNAKDGYTYKAYQVLQLEQYNTEANAYLYKAAPAWAEWLAGQNEFVSIENGYVQWAGSADTQQADAAAFAQQAVAFAVEKGIAPTREATAAGTTVEFKDLNLGYYVVDSSMGALCSLNTTNPEAEITEKNDVPTIDKQVQEGNDWDIANDAAIGGTVNFQIIVTGQPGAQNYVIHDTMTDGLTFDPNNVVITLNGTPVEPVSYTLNTEPTDECTFEITFTQPFCDAIKKNDQIVVSYSAVLNENAVVKVAETNEAKLSYGDGNTLTSTTETYTWGMKVIKVNGNDTAQKLAGAKFTLQKQGSNEPIGFVAGTAVEGTPVYTVAPAGAITEIETTEAGEFFIYGLDSGTYELVETQAPTGFNKMTEPIEVTISKDAETGIANIEEVTVENLTGLQLPSTGGMGTTVLYIVGGVLVLGAIIFLVRRRSSATK